MKYHTTEREIKNSAYAVIAIGYCDIQKIEKYLDVESYTSGVYGWNSDIYRLPNTNIYISTGYRPFSFCYSTSKKNKQLLEQLKQDLLKLENRLKKGIVKTNSSFTKDKNKIQRLIKKLTDKFFQNYEI